MVRRLLGIGQRCLRRHWWERLGLARELGRSKHVVDAFRREVRVAREAARIEIDETGVCERPSDIALGLDVEVADDDPSVRIRRERLPLRKELAELYEAELETKMRIRDGDLSFANDDGHDERDVPTLIGVLEPLMVVRGDVRNESGAP